MMRVIKIEAVWCPGCLVMKKVWKKLLNEIEDLEIISYDYDIDSDKVVEYNPGNVLPVVIFEDANGNEIERLIGEVKEETLRDKILQYKER